MSEVSPNQGRFRIYAFTWLIGSATVTLIAFDASGLSGSGMAIYLGVGAALWAVNMILTRGESRNGHGLAHAVLTAALALLWPLAIVVLVGCLIALAGCLVYGGALKLRKMALENQNSGRA